jgi:hypothetical protein
VRRIIAAAIASATLAAGPAALAGGSSRCQWLAARASALADSAWAGGSAALRPWLDIDRTDEPPKGFEAALARSPAVTQALGVDGDAVVFVDHLKGSDLYAASMSQGTLHCQTYAFVRAAPGRPARVIAGPPGAVQGTEGDGLCWTRTGDFGRILGDPAFVEHGPNDQATDDEDIRITPWARDHWAPGCILRLRYRPAFTVTERHCGAAAVCAAADRAVLAIAAAYHQKRQNPRDDTPFRYAGAQAVPAAVERAIAAHGPDMDTPELPTFTDAADGDPFSNSGLSYFPLSLNGRVYVAAVGHEGVGWRETNTTLLAIYRLENGALVPQAGYAIDRTIGGLTSASAEAAGR